MRGILILIALMLWVMSSYISIYFFPPISEENINNFWDFKKVIYSLVIALTMLSTNWRDNRLAIFTRIIFLGVLLEDITDRLLFNTKEMEINDVIMIVTTLGIATIITFKKKIYALYNQIFNNQLHGNHRY